MALHVIFHGFLRGVELAWLSREDILLPEDVVGVSTCGLRVRESKTGPNQWAWILDPAVIPMLRYLRSVTPPGGRVFPSQKELNSSLAWCTELCNIDASFTVHSLRHGRASLETLLRTHPEEIRRLGPAVGVL